ncbi:serpin family protein [Nocardia sp. NPDC058658]|uniref:serpin family protein n=1 Tax=Nocardia sp. NPDC058658 TaxID=3346580 RepID=UPI0036561EAB
MGSSLVPHVRASNALTGRWCATFGGEDAVVSGAGLWPLLAISAAGQNVVARFDAAGFEAAAVTAAAMVAGSVPRKGWATITSVDIDRPFGFLAVDRPTGLVLVAGQVTAPPLEWVRPVGEEPSAGLIPVAPW